MADTDSLCTLMEQCSLLEKEKTRFLSQLADFPNTFQLQNQDQLSTSQLKRFKSGLESALSAGYKTTLETARAKNLLSYCLFRLNDSEKALQQLDVVIKMDAHNLVTLANKAIILWNQQRLSEADDFVASLTQMKTQVDDFHYLVVRANAELAFTYTRLGPSFSHCAIAKFEEVLPRARESEKWLWKFGLALTRRRALRASPEHVSVRPSEHSAAEKRDLLLLFKEIAENCSSKNLKAKTYAEMASLLYMVSKTPLRNEFYFRARLNPEQACEKALHLDSNDNSVLCKCGKLFRYFRRTEESRDLLEKALTIRPSSTAYHHLGLTYKALANKEKYKDQVKVPGYYRQLEEQQKTARGAQNMNRGNQQFRQLSAGRPQYSRGESSSYRRAMGSAAAGSDTGDGLTYSLNRDVRVMQRMIKSPPKGVTRYSRNDKFITETLQNLEKAVQFSEGMNTPALYDLALLHKSLGELEEAKENLKEIMLKQQSTMFAADRINAYEQLGCVLQELAESTTDTVTREHMFHDRNTMLYYAVKISSQVFSRSLGVKEHLGELYSSFSVLLQDVERSDHEPSRKLQEKARLFQLINDHPHCLEVLQELKQMDPQKCEEPQYLKQVIESHVAIGQFMEALVYVELIKCTAQSTTIMELFEDKHYVVKIYVQAARQALLNGSSTAKLHFKYAFDEATATNLDENSSSGCEDTDSSEDSKAETWDVGIVCEETDEALTNATILSELLEETLGLKVAIPCRDAPPNKSDLEGELQMLLKSTVVIVMTGSKPSRKNRLFLHNIAKRPSTVALLVDGDHLPKLLKTNRSLVCPPGLLHSSSTAACRKMTESEADTICEFFSFLVIDSNTQEA